MHIRVGYDIAFDLPARTSLVLLLRLHPSEEHRLVRPEVTSINPELPQGGTALSGEAGWVGTGLLGAVLGWLLVVYLPAKDKQVRELIDKAVEARREMLAYMAEERTLERASRNELLAAERASRNELVSAVVKTLRREEEG